MSSAPSADENALFLGVDIGGSVVKAAAFDAHGREVACSGSRLSIVQTAPGRNERAPDDMWNATASAIRKVVSRVPGGAPRIAALSCAGHGNGLYLLDQELRPLGHGIVSSDTRAESLLAGFENHPDARPVTLRRGQRFGSAEPSLLMSWLDRCEPERSRQVAHIVMCKDYVRLCLTGRLEMDLCDASGAALVDIVSHQYSVQNLDILGLSHWVPKLPPLRSSTAVCGGVSASAAQVTGLREGTPVAAGAMDLEAVTLGSGVLDEAHLVMSAGTWNIAMQVLEQPTLDPLPLMQAICRNGTRYLLAEGSPTGAVNLAWLLGEILDMQSPDWDRINDLVESLPPEATQIIHLPFINGSAGDPQAGFLGITGATRRAHLLRAVYESTAFMHRLHRDELVEVTGRPPRCGRLSGGVARSPTWSQMFADVLGIRVEVSEGTELGALGCAMIAAVAIGRFADLEDAVGAMNRTACAYTPGDRLEEIYDRKFGMFARLQQALRPHWKEFAGWPAPRRRRDQQNQHREEEQ